MDDETLPLDVEIDYGQSPQQKTWYGNILDGFTNTLGTGLSYIKSGLGSLTNPIGTGKDAKTGLDYGLGIGSLVYNIWKDNKQLGLYKQGLQNQKDLALANLSNSINTQGANMGLLATMASDWSKPYGQKVASNYAAALQSGANTIKSLGGDTSGIQNQISTLNKLVS